jgi:hypothetical protein
MRISSRDKPTGCDARAIGLVVGFQAFTVCLSDGRQISVPYHCFPRLENANQQERVHFEVCAGGRMLHWPDIDEDIEVKHIIEGRMPVKEAPRVTAVAESRTKYGC